MWAHEKSLQEGSRWPVRTGAGLKVIMLRKLLPTGRSRAQATCGGSGHGHALTFLVVCHPLLYVNNMQESQDKTRPDSSGAAWRRGPAGKVLPGGDI